MQTAQNHDEVSLVTIIVENKAGMLMKMTEFWAKNGINIERLSISYEVNDRNFQRLTIYLSGDRAKVTELMPEIAKIDGIKFAESFVADENKYIEKEMALIKISSVNMSGPNLMNLVSDYQGKLIYTGQDVMVFQVEASEEKMDKFLEIALTITKDMEVVRSGLVAVSLDRTFIGLNK